MSLAQMSFYGAVLTIVVTIVRALAINRLPKRTFIILWCVVLFRLLVPFEITSPYSVYSFVGNETQMSEISAMKTSVHASKEAGTEASTQPSETIGDSESMQSEKTLAKNILTPQSELSDGSILEKLTNLVNRAGNMTFIIIWGIGAVLCMFFLA